jgi:hypothetical protein
MSKSTPAEQADLFNHSFSTCLLLLPGSIARQRRRIMPISFRGHSEKFRSNGREYES